MLSQNQSGVSGIFIVLIDVQTYGTAYKTELVTFHIVKKDMQLKYSLDRAAFCLSFGAKLIRLEGRYPDTWFILSLPKWLVIYEWVGGWIPANKYMNERRKLKRESRIFSGLPASFLGDKHTGFKLGDIAHVRPFTKYEQSKYQ